MAASRSTCAFAAACLTLAVCMMAAPTLAVSVPSSLVGLHGTYVYQGNYRLELSAGSDPSYNVVVKYLDDPGKPSAYGYINPGTLTGTMTFPGAGTFGVTYVPATAYSPARLDFSNNTTWVKDSHVVPDSLAPLFGQFIYQGYYRLEVSFSSETMYNVAVDYLDDPGKPSAYGYISPESLTGTMTFPGAGTFAVTYVPATASSPARLDYSNNTTWIKGK